MKSGMPATAPSSRGIRAVALLEAAKGAIALLAACGLLWAFHAGAAQWVDELARHLHLNPAKGVPRVLAALADDLADTRLWLLAAGVSAYVLTRAIEAYGLWHERRWAQWFSVASGVVYVPFELYELAQGLSALKLVTLGTNLGIVIFMARALRAPRRSR